MRVNRLSPLPLYRQLADILRTEISAGKYAARGRIPSEPELAETYGVGRPTVRQAVELLVREALLERRKGSGTFVREPPADIDLFSLAGTLSAFREKGIAVTRRMVRKIELCDVPAGRDNPFGGGRAYFFSRISFARSEPILMEDVFLDPQLFHGIDRYDFAKESLSDVVRNKYFAAPVSCRQTFRAVRDRRRTAFLHLPPSRPLLEVTRTINFAEHPSGIFSLFFCRTDRFTFSQTLGGSP